MTTETNPTWNHGGIDITYNEEKECFEFELRGVHRRATTLANARKAIDAPVPEGKKKFERFTAYLPENSWHATNSYRKVTVTSLLNDGSYDGSLEAWYSEPNKKERGKTRVHNFVADTPANLEKMAEIDDLAKKIRALEDEREAIRKKLVKVDIKTADIA